jgi:hypothetical protein
VTSAVEDIPVEAGEGADGEAPTDESARRRSTLASGAAAAVDALRRTGRTAHARVLRFHEAPPAFVQGVVQVRTQGARTPHACGSVR